MATLEYRRKIDGLRALAVLAVIFYHAGLRLFSGGYVGVDVFFVISGYLITSIIRNDCAAGRFSIVNFYERRIRRILPALYFITATCFVAGSIVLFPSEFKDFSKSLLAVIFFVSNIFFYKTQNYFAADAELSPLLQTWSLAVEEQFYVFFPLLFFICWKYFRRGVPYILFFCAAASFLLAGLHWADDSSRVFFLAHYRAWELLAGSLCALWGRQAGRPGIPLWVCNLLSAGGLAVVCRSMILYTDKTPFVGVNALLPILGTAAFILFADSRTLAGRIFSTRPLVGIGLISYSLYLWHQPIFAFARIAALPRRASWLLRA